MHDIEITEITPLPHWRMVHFKVETEVGQELCCYVSGSELYPGGRFNGDIGDAFKARRGEIEAVARDQINLFLDQCADDYTDPACSHPLKIALQRHPATA